MITLRLISALNTVIERDNSDSLLKLVASPETINDTEFRLNQSAVNKQYFDKLSRDSRKVAVYEKTPDVILYAYPAQYALLDLAKNEVLYYMQFERHSIFGVPAITQIKVWASPYSKHTRESLEGEDSLTSYVFFNLLMPKAAMIVTDGMQTSAGRRFWQKRIDQAFERQLYVYGLDQNRKARKRFESVEGWRKFEGYFYGESHKHQARKIGISPNLYKSN